MRYEDDEFDSSLIEDELDFEWPFTEERKSKAPLRWIVDYILHPISMKYFGKGYALYCLYENEYDEDENFIPPFFDNIKMKAYNRLFLIFNKPYMKWGTTYVWDIDKE